MRIESYSRRSSIFFGERKCTVFQRFAAKGIDLLLASAIYFLGTVFAKPLGALLAALFLSMQDSSGNGQSIGKKIIGLRVIDDETGLNCPIWYSALRNVPFTILWLFAFTPIALFIALLIGIPLVILECYLIFMVDSGIRLGDIMGNTLVVEHRDEEFDTAP